MCTGKEEEGVKEANERGPAEGSTGEVQSGGSERLHVGRAEGARFVDVDTW